MKKGLRMMSAQLGERLRALRKSRNLTTQQLAKKVSVSQSYISRFENNKAIPNIELLDKILKALHSDLASFFASEAEKISVEQLQLTETIKTLTPEAQEKLNEFLQLVHKK